MADLGYEDIDAWNREQRALVQQQQQTQEDLTNKQTQLAVDELARQKNKIDTDTTKTTRGLYTDYQKQANQYGVNAEKQASVGLANSGYSETAQTNLYNNYQKSVTDTLNNARTLKSDFDFQIAQAREKGNITLAQNALELYKQQMQLLSQEYEMRNNRRQFIYQQDRDRVSDNQWQQQFDRQNNQWQQQFDYQKQRDAVSDSQWERQYELSKKASTSSSRSSRSSSSSKKSGNNPVEINTENNSKPTMSDNASTLYESLAKTLSSNQGKPTEAYIRTMASNTVKNAISKGKISQNDGILIGEKLGL